ncbi:MAG: deoxyribodipyrimidine photo-lyase, partial [Planctomycetota bacterium]
MTDRYPGGTPRPHAVWFRQDLRVDDHRPLLTAAARAERAGAPLHCVYVLDPREFGPAPLLSPHIALKRTGPFRARFLVECLASLREELRGLGGELIVRRGDPVSVLAAMAEEERWEALHYHELVGTEERSQEKRLARKLRAGEASVDVTGHWDRTLHDEYPFEVSETPEVFSRFRKVVEKRLEVAAPELPPKRIPGPGRVEPGELPTLAEVDAVGIVDDERAVHRFPGGAKAANEQLSAFVWGGPIATYKETRNGLIGADYSSKLSPWLALGAISCRRVQDEVFRFEEERGANESTYWVFFELLWRDYFQLIVKRHGARVPRDLDALQARCPEN